MLRQVFLGLSENARARAFALHNPVARRASRRFVAGETLDDALAAAEQLSKRGFRVSLNHLGEKTTAPDDAKAAADAYHETLRRIRGRPEDWYVSVKLTQLGLDFDRE